MHLLFDLDGTLTNPFLGITNCIQYSLEKLGRTPPSPDDLRWCIGPPLRESFFSLLETDDPALADEGVALYRERFGDVGLFENEVYPGIPECLDTLQAAGYGMSVATSKPQVYAKRIVEHFELSHFFSSIDGAELDGTRTEKPKLLSYILDRYGYDRSEIVMIGDRRHDVEGAIANGVYPVSVLWGYGSHEELEEAGATTFAESPGQLAKLIGQVERANV